MLSSCARVGVCAQKGIGRWIYPGFPLLNWDQLSCGPGLKHPGPPGGAAREPGRHRKLYNISDERENRVKASLAAGLSSALLGNYNAFSQ